MAHRTHDDSAAPCSAPDCSAPADVAFQTDDGDAYCEHCAIALVMAFGPELATAMNAEAMAS